MPIRGIHAALPWQTGEAEVQFLSSTSSSCYCRYLGTLKPLAQICERL